MTWTQRLDPAVPVCALAALTPLVVAPPLFDQVVMPRLAATFVLTGLALGCAAASSFRPYRDVPAAPARVAATFLGLTALSTGIGVDPRGALLGEFQRYQGLITVTVCTLLMLVTGAAATTSSKVRFLAWSFLFGGAVASLYAILDVAGLDWIDWSNASSRRAGGLFAQPNVLATQLVVCALVGTGLMSHESGWRQAVAAAATGAMLAVLVLTMSRGGWVAAVIGACAFVSLSQRITRATLLAAAGVGVLSLAAVAAIPQSRTVLDSAVARADAGSDIDNQSTRLSLWRLAFEMWEDHPVLGGGPDSFSTLFPSYREPDQPGIGTANVRPESAHSFFFDQLVGLGALGVTAFVALVALVLFPALRSRGGGPLEPIAASFAAAIVAYFIAVAFSFSEAMTGWMPWVLMGGLLGLSHQRSGAGERRPADRVVSSWTRGGLLAAGLVAILSGCLLVLADWNAGRAATRSDANAAVEHARFASRINPLLPGYLLQLGELEIAAGRYDEAAHHFHEANVRFAPTAYSLIAEADALFLVDSERNRERILALLVAAETLDPHNEPAAASIDGIRQSIEEAN